MKKNFGPFAFLFHVQSQIISVVKRKFTRNKLSPSYLKAHLIYVAGLVIVLLLFGLLGCPEPENSTPPESTPPEAVGTPTFSIPSGTYSSDQLVSITCSTPGAAIYCTTDGTTPSTSSTTYTSPISVAGNGTTKTIKALAAKAGMTNSTVSSATYTINYPAPEPLSWMEEQVAQKWHRYHAYDDSDMYYIFRDDRTGCYFEITSSGSRRGNTCYVYWELDEENPVASNVFKVMVKLSSGGTLYSIGDYHYVDNEIWKGGYSNLDMFPSSTSRDCECN